LKPIESNLEFKRKQSDNQLLLYNDTVRIKFTSETFQKEKHKIRITKESGVSKIDGHSLIGTDGDMPRKGIKTFTIEMDRKKINLPQNIFFDLY
jgi:hypothetical protein